MQMEKTIKTELAVQEQSKELSLAKLLECLKGSKEFKVWQSKTPRCQSELTTGNVLSYYLDWSGGLDQKSPYFWGNACMHNGSMIDILKWILQEPKAYDCHKNYKVEELPYDIRYELGKYYGRDIHSVVTYTGKLRNAMAAGDKELVEKLMKQLRIQLGI